MSGFAPRIGREEFKRLAPGVAAALAALGEAASQAGLDPALLELVKLRASQINGCAFCIQYHLTAARALRIPREKLDLLAVWQEVGLFSEQERAALGWTETLTEVTLGVTDEDYEEARAHFSAVQLAHLSGAIALINGWNRIAAGFRFAPEPPGPRAVT
ncbi:carboxymuconolactone decarboxylase family protein [Enterovirga sp.]|uniref:carboxymuconolactone decarboxylase family protein n=1 Tax=Enterovirga sp. TaxID=2026350 RepID=UPI002635142B|nr:carboxymuconolactone decarboxylase family protein [Enterovirga sp.]MDB5591040.1 carboxymuconolactone decarboxylase family protein [Enterovirga sp.]